jgi:hypothetical protein
MLNRRASLIELSVVPGVSDNSLDQVEDNVTKLCDRCQRFDLQSFARDASRRYGYALRDVEAAASNGCEFCTLLLDSVKDVEKPAYFSTTIFGRRRPRNPDLYVYMTLSENYVQSKTPPGLSGLRVNRLLTEIGDAYTKLTSASDHELCLAADPS